MRSRDTRLRAKGESSEADRTLRQTVRRTRLGAEPGKSNKRAFTEADALFRKLFGDELPELEAGFREWLQALG